MGIHAAWIKMKLQEMIGHGSPQGEDTTEEQNLWNNGAHTHSQHSHAQGHLSRAEISTQSRGCF